MARKYQIPSLQNYLDWIKLNEGLWLTSIKRIAEYDA